MRSYWVGPGSPNIDTLILLPMLLTYVFLIIEIKFIPNVLIKFRKHRKYTYRRANLRGAHVRNPTHTLYNTFLFERLLRPT